MNQLLGEIRNLSSSSKCRSRVSKLNRIRLYLQFVWIVRYYGNVYREIGIYNRMVSRYLTELFLGWIMLITFIAYLLFLTAAEPPYKVLFTLVQLANVWLLGMCSLGGAQIAKLNIKLGIQMRRFYCEASKIGFRPVTLLKVRK